MDDLSGLDWSSNKNNNNSNPKPQPSNSRPAFSYPSLQPTPSPSGSGRSTPLSISNFQNTGNSAKVLKPTSKPSTPANDSFASLLNPSANKQQDTLSLQERQKQLIKEKAEQEAERNRKLAAQYGSQQNTFWDGLGQSRTTSPPLTSPLSASTSLSGAINKPFANINGPRGTRIPQAQDEEDDLLAAFSSTAPVDRSSHYPPEQFGSGSSTPVTKSRSPLPTQVSSNGAFDFADDDDPFGLSQVKSKPGPSARPLTNNGTGDDDDDILGMLGRPVSELPKPAPSPKPSPKVRSPSPPSRPAVQDDHPQAKAVTELVDMGFPADKAAIALAQTDTGMNVHAAVGMLLNQAHEESRQKARGRPETANHNTRDDDKSRRPQQESRGDPSMPAWMRADNERDRSGSRSNEGRSQQQDKDFAKQAQDIGTSLLKSANSLWKTGQKKVQKAVADFQQEGDPSQPKWMREAQLREAVGQKRLPAERANKVPDPSMTNEAMMLEGGGKPSKPPKSTDISRSSTPALSDIGSWNDIPDDMFAARKAPTSRASSRQPPIRAAHRLTRQEVEDTVAEVSVSSRRRRPAPTAAVPASSKPPTRDASPAISPPLQSRNPFNPNPSTPAASSKPATPIPTRPKAPPRNVPSVSALALQNSSKQRASGSEAFKRGDYSTAHAHYTSSLQGVPSSHPIAIIIYCNRALTNIKVGDPKAAIVDADLALSVIGISRGEGEKIALGGAEGEKEMKEFYGKALMRKAEALEHMEKWADAAKVWRDAIEAGVGGSVSMQGRNRCEKAAGGGSANGSASTSTRSTPASRPAARKPPPRPATSAVAAMAPPSAASAEAVRKVREASAAAEKLDDEKFALTEAVDAKLAAWKGTKADNLRALLGSLEKVLWEEAGWKKVGMQDLVMPNRVKIVYMKAIAKVHPDKIAQNATTEQRMISASVFATLNEAWDKFKGDNGL